MIVNNLKAISTDYNRVFVGFDHKEIVDGNISKIFSFLIVKEPSKRVMHIVHLICVLIIFIGATIPMDAVWAMADITMGFMIVINLPVCI